MSFKSLFFTDEGNKKKSEKSTKKEVSDTKFTSKFPTQTPDVGNFQTTSGTSDFDSVIPTKPVQPSQPSKELSCEPYMDKVLTMYEKGFNNLNIDGYDFFEFFKAVSQVGTANPQAFNMAFTMAKTMDPNITKESLIQQSEYYITELQKVHNNYSTNGNNKKKSVTDNKAKDKQELEQELKSYQTQIDNLVKLQSATKESLDSLDSKYDGTLHDIDCKLMANDVAKDKIINSINLVVNGIKTNI